MNCSEGSLAFQFVLFFFGIVEERENKGDDKQPDCGIEKFRTIVNRANAGRKTAANKIRADEQIEAHTDRGNKEEVR
jgi:hypothetical protein